MAGQNKEGAESMKRYKIMIIEDDPVIQGELQTLLNGNGYATIGIKDFSAVIEQIQDEKPHLILLDIKLPGENGFALCSKIRTFSEVPIIFVTSCNTDMDELNSIMLGGDALILYYLFKNGGKICSRGDIIEYLWDNQLYVDDNALSVNINRIREKLASIGLTDFIKTKHRQGYTI